MNPSRPKLNIVDDPVTGRSARPLTRPASPASVAASSTEDPNAPEIAPNAAEATASEPNLPAEQARSAPRFGQEDRRAVFGRIPRTLTRRLERALVELREDLEDLTQEQLLAALLSEYVDPSDPKRLAALRSTVEAYRARL
jgi:hypothetical protein